MCSQSNNKGYVGTGYTPMLKKDFWEWDQVSDTWAQKADVGGTSRDAGVGFSIGNKGYIGAGWDSLGLMKRDFWEYDPNGISGIIEPQGQVYISIYPNPFSIKTAFFINNEVHNAYLKIFNVSGEEVKSISFSGKQILFERENLPSGIYFYKIILKNKSLVGKIIVQ